MPRPVSADLLLMHEGHNLSDCEHEEQSALSLSHTPFYRHSDKGDDIAPYFFGDSKTSLVFDQEGKGDVHPRWVSAFAKDGESLKSTITMNPKRSTWGVVFRMTQKFPALHEGAWVRAILPLVEVTHKLNLSESVTGTKHNDATFGTITEALNFDNWRAGKWESASQTTRGLDDVLLQAGITVGEKSKQTYYLEACLPMGNRPTAQYLFEPLIGSAGHAGIGGGIQSNFPLMKWGDVQCAFVSHLHYRYLFTSVQQRTLDLKNQPFSRFLLFLDTIQAIGNSYEMHGGNGVNLFTRDVVVDPGATGQGMQALSFTYKNHEFRLGYGYWWRTSEQILLHGSVQREYAVPVKASAVSGKQWLPSPLVKEGWTTKGETAAGVDIETDTPDAVTDNELDMASGAAPFTASHTLSASYNGRFVWNDAAFVLGLGGSYEMAYNTASLNNYCLWATLGLQF